MPSSSYLSKSVNKTIVADRAAVGALTTTESFRLALERERVRADRSGGLFSLVVFVPLDTSARALRDELARHLLLRVRVTDVVVFPEESSAGVILLDCIKSHARRIADEVLERLNADASFEVVTYEYPTDEDFASATESPARRLDAGHVAGPPRSMFTRPLPIWKRLVDLIGAGLGLILLFPLLLAIACAVKITSPGPCLFTQTRAGLGGRRFRMYKFRSMQVDAEDLQKNLLPSNEQDGPAFKLSDDPRVTGLGKMLRKTSLDELPQLWNVLKGDMSLVGPRPLPCHEQAAAKRWQQRRLDVTPGMTCEWQVRGRSRVSFAEWMRMDIRYTSRRSFLEDVRLLCATLPAVLTRRGAK